jgi:hypothetical protein
VHCVVCYWCCSLIKLRESGQLTFLDGLKRILDSCLLTAGPVDSGVDLTIVYADIRQAVTEGCLIILDNISALFCVGAQERCAGCFLMFIFIKIKICARCPICNQYNHDDVLNQFSLFIYIKKNQK